MMQFSIGIYFVFAWRNIIIHRTLPAISPKTKKKTRSYSKRTYHAKIQVFLCIIIFSDIGLEVT